MGLHGVKLMDDAGYKAILNRLDRLEAAVFSDSEKHKKSESVIANRKGATGAIRLLIDEGFLNEKRQLRDVRTAASGRGYHYSSQAFHDALTRLSTKEKLLVALTEKGRKSYAIRK